MSTRRYVVVPVGIAGEGLSAKIAELEAKVYREAEPGFWLVAYDGTSKELSDAIGLGDDESLGTAIVVPVDGYSGYAPSDLWDWLKLHRGNA